MKSMKNRLAIANLVRVGLLLGLLTTFSVGAKELSYVVLSVGQVKTIQVGSVVRVAVGRDDLVNVSPMDNGDIVLMPTAAGETELLIWKEGGRTEKFSLKILPNNMQALKQEVDSIFRDYPTLRTRISSDKIIVEGTVDPSIVDPISGLIDDLPNTIGLITPLFTSRDMINIKVTVLEIDKTYRRDIGLRWADSAEGPTLGLLNNFSPNNLFNDLGQGSTGLVSESRSTFADALTRLPLDSRDYYSFGGIASTLTSSIQLIEENGGGRILAEPVLSARSGESARFFAGGEVPFQTVGPLGQPNIEFFDFGVILEVEPVYDGSGQILTRINTEVSTLDNSVSVAGVPGKLTRQSESTIDVKNGETIAISGLVLTNDTRTVDQIPLLGSIPVIGNLFKSKAFQEQRTELVILVTPRVVASNDKGGFGKEMQDIKSEMESVLGGNSVLQQELAR